MLRKSLPGFDCHKSLIGLISGKRQYERQHPRNDYATSGSDFSRREGVGMEGRVTSVFLYVKDVRRSLEFYNEVVGAEVVQIHAESEGAPISLAILRIGGLHSDAASPGAPCR